MKRKKPSPPICLATHRKKRSAKKWVKQKDRSSISPVTKLASPPNKLPPDVSSIQGHGYSHSISQFRSSNMTNLSVFEFDSESIEITVVDNKPWFNASQTAKALGYANPSKALQDNVSPKYNQQLDLGRPGKQPIFINEPGLYQLIMRSNLPKAERFQEWVFEEVLPSIRKTGTYSVPAPAPQLSSMDILAQNMQALAEVARSMAETERRQLEQEQRQREHEQQLKQQAEVLAEIVANKQQAEEELAALPLSEEPAAEISIRNRINMIVRSYADRTHAAHRDVWSKLYKELYYRCSFDVNARCKNSKRSKLDQIEENGMIEKLYAIASEVLA